VAQVRLDAAQRKDHAPASNQQRTSVGDTEENEMNQCKHRWLLTPSPHRTQYHYQCAKCAQVAWAAIKEKE
jgi:hypothetical protein